MTEQWKAYGYGENNRCKCHVLDAKGHAVASVSGGLDRARLISAAPDLLEALEWIACEASQYADGAEDSHYLAREMANFEAKARTAIAKAKGESQ